MSDNPFAIRAAFAFAALLVVLAALIRTWAAAYLRSSVVHDGQLHTDALVASGPYRYVRNPLYIGGLLLSVGMGMVASRTGAIVIIGGALAITLALIDAEERHLTAAQGESYAAYRRSVPRLVPSLTPRLPAANLAPRWTHASARATSIKVVTVTSRNGRSHGTGLGFCEVRCSCGRWYWLS